MVTDYLIERRIRYRLERHGMKMHKCYDTATHKTSFFIFEIGGDDTRPADDEQHRWFSLEELNNYCEELEEKEKEERYLQNV